MTEGKLGESWISQLKAGDSVAAQKLWEAYHEQLVRFARKKLRAVPRRAADEDDVAVSAFNSFWQAAVQGKFPQLNDSDDLWKILVTITARKALRQAQHARRQKRGEGKVRGESVFRQADASEPDWGIEQVVGREPTPAYAAEVTENLRRLLECLDDDGLRQLAVLKMQGYTNQEIAEKLDCGLRSVERKLSGIRTIWSNEREE